MAQQGSAGKDDAGGGAADRPVTGGGGRARTAPVIVSAHFTLAELSGVAAADVTPLALTLASLEDLRGRLSLERGREVAIRVHDYERSAEKAAHRAERQVWLHNALGEVQGYGWTDQVWDVVLRQWAPRVDGQPVLLAGRYSRESRHFNGLAVDVSAMVRSKSGEVTHVPLAEVASAALSSFDGCVVGYTTYVHADNRTRWAAIQRVRGDAP